MRSNVKQFAKLIRTTLPISSPLYEFGSLQVPGQVGFADLRALFDGEEYVGCDMQNGPGVDKVLNLHDIEQESESVGMVLSFDTLEHVEYPRKAMSEIHRILKPDGIVVITSVMKFPIHDYPYDYWRFTPEAFKSLLKPFKNSFVGFQGEKTFPHTVVGVGFKGDEPPLNDFKEEYAKWKKSDLKSVRQLVLRLTPPLFIPAIAAVRRGITNRK